MRVFRIKTFEGENLYIQKVTDKTICVVMSDNEVVHFNLSTGKFRGPKASKDKEYLSKLTIPTTPIKKFMQVNNISEWDGGWKTRCNSRGEVKNPDMPKLKKFKGHDNPIERWFEFQGVKVSPLNA